MLYNDNDNSNKEISLQENKLFSSPNAIEKVHKDIENNKNIEVDNIPRNTPFLHHHDTPQAPKENLEYSFEQVDKDTELLKWIMNYCLDKVLQKWIGFLRQKLYKQ